MRICDRCGTALTDNTIFCWKCGKKVSNQVYYRNMNSVEINPEESNNKPQKSVLNKIVLLVCIVVVVIGIVKYITPKFSTEWAVDKACAEVKSEVYKDYGEVPRVSGEFIYRDGENYIIAVTYTVPSLDWEASCACLIYGYREDNCHLKRMTNELPHDYDYKDNLEELKALWALE